MKPSIPNLCFSIQLTHLQQTTQWPTVLTFLLHDFHHQKGSPNFLIPRPGSHGEETLQSLGSQNCHSDNSRLLSFQGNTMKWLPFPFLMLHKMHMETLQILHFLIVLQSLLLKPNSILLPAKLMKRTFISCVGCLEECLCPQARLF